MKEEYWTELLDIFADKPELQEAHEKLFNTLSLIVKLNELSKELENVNKQLTELNKKGNE